MRVLVDTHALVWWLAEPARLGRNALDVMRDGSNDLLVSAVSAYEIDYKRGGDALLRRLPADLEAAVEAQGFEWAAVTAADASTAARLPLHHRDPWDRLIIAQASRGAMPLISTDRHFAPYGVQLIW